MNEILELLILRLGAKQRVRVSAAAAGRAGPNGGKPPAQAAPPSRSCLLRLSILMSVLLVSAGLLGCGGTKPEPKQQLAPPVDPKLSPVVGTGKTITNSIGMKLVLIPAGKFMMGSPASEKDREEDEGPQHEVEITKPFYMGVHEVTQEEYEQMMGTNPSHFKGKKNPVEMVSYNDAVEFCKKLSAQSEEKRAGWTYRLPTEAEWEYACRAGTTTVFYFGNSLTSEQANFNGEYPYGRTADGKYLEKTVAVGSYEANAFGLYDMHGNVWELCADWYEGGYYKDSPRQNPENTKEDSFRVVRGGGWDLVGRLCRSTIRIWRMPDSRYRNLGFRVVAVQSR